MRLTIQCDPTQCLAAGYEPADSLEIDLSTLSTDDRLAIASIMDGFRITRTLPMPTVEGLLLVARQAKAAADAAAEKETQKEAARKQKLEADRVELERILRDRPQRERQCHETHLAADGSRVKYEYTMIAPDIPATLDIWYQPEDLKQQYYAWRDQCQAETERRAKEARDVAIAAAVAARREAAAARATMTVPEIVASLPEKVREDIGERWDRVVVDTEDQLVLARTTKHPKLTRYAKIDLHTMTAAQGVAFTDSGTLMETTSYPVNDGVLRIDGSTWAAVVADPAAVRPQYEFLRRAPGGYEAPALNIGDIIVWGAKDKKGRKQGPYDRLVYSIADDKVYVIKTDYATARKIRRLLLD